MTKHVQSHEENNSHLKNLSVIKAQEAILANYKTSDIVLYKSRMLDPTALPFFEDWKVRQIELKNARVNPLKNIQENALKSAATLDFTGNSDIIKDNEFVLKELPSYYLHEEYVELCNKYHIPYKEVYHNYRELDATEELVADYIDLLKTAKNLCIYWDTSTFDMEGLQEAIEEARSEEADHGYFADLRSDRWAYYSSTGV